jgi:hypothetical protein
MANDPVLLNKVVAESMIKNRFGIGFFQKKSNQEFAKWSGDFAEFNGKAIMDDINGSVINAERPVLEMDELSKSLKDFGPSVRLNVQNQEALKGLRFTGEIGEFSTKDDKGLYRWFFELNNTVGKRNGKFGNIVLWNIGKKEDVVIAKLVEYIKGPGNDIAKKFAIYSEGPEMLATKIYADATLALRDYSGKINMDLVNAIRNKKGMDNFTLDDLAALDKPFARPEVVLGKEIIENNELGEKTLEKTLNYFRQQDQNNLILYSMETLPLVVQYSPLCEKLEEMMDYIERSTDLIVSWNLNLDFTMYYISRYIYHSRLNEIKKVALYANLMSNENTLLFYREYVNQLIKKYEK